MLDTWEGGWDSGPSCLDTWEGGWDCLVGFWGPLRPPFGHSFPGVWLLSSGAPWRAEARFPPKSP